VPTPLHARTTTFGIDDVRQARLIQPRDTGGAPVTVDDHLVTVAPVTRRAPCASAAGQ